MKAEYEYGDVHVINLIFMFMFRGRLLTYADNKCANQHAHPHSKISEFKLFTAYFFVEYTFLSTCILINGAAINKRLQILI